MRILNFLSELAIQIAVGASMKPATAKAWQRSSPHVDTTGRDWIERINS